MGFIESKVISLLKWALFVDSRATFAQSTVRQFSRWLNNKRIKVHEMYGPIIQEAMSEWKDHLIYLALDTSMLWDQFCHMSIRERPLRRSP